jgi:MYXO-CTERM domain-containing protein
MFRTSAPTWLALVASGMVASSAWAAPNSSTTTEPDQHPAQIGRRVAEVTPVEAFVTPHAQISKTLYVERCVGGCTVNKGNINDARTMTSTIPVGNGPFLISEFVNKDQQSGAAADEEWNAMMQCLREVYSPFDVEVTDVKPPPGVSHHVAIAAGVPTEIGRGNDILGIAPLAGDCGPQDNVISFSFANAHRFNDPQRVYSLCWTVAQESAHAFGLDHSYSYQDGRSACNDPMTYRTDCGGQRFFRNEPANCGEYEPRTCQCGGTQNTHIKLVNVFGPGESIIENPTVSVVVPQNGQALAGAVGVQAGSRRGIQRVELLLNGYKWGEVKGAAFGGNGQPNPSTYTIPVPSNVPASKIDLVVRAYDDLGNYTDSPTISTYKGSPQGCSDASVCAPGQKCEEGKCFWEPAVGEIGDACTFQQYCLSGNCQGVGEDKICTQQCIVGSVGACPEGLECLDQGGGRGFCYFSEDSGGCCSVGDEGSSWLQGALSLGVLGLLAFRPRRRRR